MTSLIIWPSRSRPCQAITDLQHRGVIALADKRTVKILNRGALEDRFGEPAMVA
jgi:CRP/FNR family nitrogen fixation transcriptional regulator